MLIIRGVEYNWSKETQYLIMDVNFFREKLWEVKIHGQSNGEWSCIRFQRSFEGISKLLEGIRCKEKTIREFKEGIERSKRELTAQEKFKLHFTISPIDLSGYRTVKWFPWLFGKYDNDSKIIEEFKGHDIAEDYPEYLI